MSRLREGGLAILIGGDPEAKGTVVETIKYVPPGATESLPAGRKIHNGGSGRWLIHSDKICVEVAPGIVIENFALCFSHHLMPIDGRDFTHEAQSERRVMHG